MAGGRLWWGSPASIARQWPSNNQYSSFAMSDRRLVGLQKRKKPARYEMQSVSASKIRSHYSGRVHHR
jgi:hypothetical protein